MSRAAARGTTYDAATGKLRASTPVKPGYHLLYLSLFDQGDRQWDSADRPPAASIAATQVLTGVSAELPHSNHEPPSTWIASTVGLNRWGSRSGC